MRFVILGCGRVGAQLAGSLLAEGHEVAVIDKDAGAFRRLGPSFTGSTVTGVGFDRDVLVRAGIETADGFASVTNGDNSNIVSALVARRVFKVPRVITRIYDPLRAGIYKKFGIPTISSTIWGANELKDHLLYQEVTSELSFGSGEAALLEFEVPPRLAGRTVADLTVPGQVLVACVVRLGRALVPTPATILEKEDLVYACVENGAMARFRELAGF